MQTQIIKAPTTNQGCFSTTIKNTEMSQRETLEEIIVNLASVLEIKKVYKHQNSRGNYFYEIQSFGFSGFQSASNTILSLSRRLSHKA